MTIRHLTSDELTAGLDHIRQSPADDGVLELIVRRPTVDAREVVDEAELTPTEGLVGDRWGRRRSREALTARDTENQLTIMNARAVALLAGDRSRWPLAGDQLYLDLDLSRENLPPGTLLAIGSAVIEVTSEPHTGCRKFSSRFGVDAVRFVNSPTGRDLQLRGINARVFQGGTVHVGDVASKLSGD
jgi:hypothetical protein